MCTAASLLRAINDELAEACPDKSTCADEAHADTAVQETIQSASGVSGALAQNVHHWAKSTLTSGGLEYIMLTKTKLRGESSLTLSTFVHLTFQCLTFWQMFTMIPFLIRALWLVCEHWSRTLVRKVITTSSKTFKQLQASFLKCTWHIHSFDFAHSSWKKSASPSSLRHTCPSIQFPSP